MAQRRLPAVWLVVAAKAGKLIAMLKLFKFTKVLITATSMLVSLLAYDLIFNPWFAVGLVLMLFVHEMGHVMAMRQKGLETPAPVFIPFLGAAIFVKNFGNRVTEAYVGYGGPLVGSIATLICLIAWWLVDSKLLLVITFIGAYLNLFNMIPIRPFDGGRVTQVIGENFKYFGLLVLIAFTIYTSEPSIIIIWMLVLLDIKMPRWWLTGIGLLLAISMTVLFAFGYGERNFWMDIVDVVLAALFLSSFIIKDIYHLTEAAPVGPYPLLSVRIKWLAYYLGLTIGLWLLMWYVIEQLSAESL